MCFWAVNDVGYTTQIKNAKKFDFKQTCAIIRSCKGSHYFKRWECNVVDKAARLTVDVQDINKK